MKVSHRMMITISGLIWVAVGILLTQIGVGLMTELLKPTVETKIAFFDNIVLIYRNQLNFYLLFE